MADLKTKYMGLELRSPIIVGASNLVTNPDNLKRIEDAGAGAIVYKTLFEEQIQMESLELQERKEEYSERNAEMVKLFPDIKPNQVNIQEHLIALKRAKEIVSIPVFASINAVNHDTWIEYAEKVSETGVDGIELNMYTAPEKSDKKYIEIEKQQIKIVKYVKSAVSVPVAIKLSPYYTNTLKLITEFENAGADGVVLFNKLFQPDIDIQAEEHLYPYSLSHKEDSRLPLRFAGLLFGRAKSSVCANSGIISSPDVIKMLLAGADTVQVVSSLYLNQIEVIRKMNDELETWMDSKGYKTIENFRGKLSEKNSQNKLPYHRTQYMDFMMTTTEILKKYRVIN